MHFDHSHEAETEVKIQLQLLSVRERQLVKYLALGYTNIEVSFSIGIARSTVKIHRSRIYKKLGVTSLKEFMHVLKVKPSFPLD